MFKAVVTVTGTDVDDLVLALGEVIKQIEDGFVWGNGKNEYSGYKYKVKEVDKQE